MINGLKEEADEDLSEITVEADAPTILGDTVDNLKASIEGEHYENTQMYPEFADAAEEEGYEDIAERLRAIGRVEEHHEERFTRILKEVEAGTVFKKTVQLNGSAGNADTYMKEQNLQKMSLL